MTKVFPAGEKTHDGAVRVIGPTDAIFLAIHVGTAKDASGKVIATLSQLIGGGLIVHVEATKNQYVVSTSDVIEAVLAIDARESSETGDIAK